MKRRDFLTGVLAGLPISAYGGQMERPPARAGRPVPATSTADIIRQFGLADKTGFVVVDLASGRVIEQHNPTLELPPASVTKAITALYAQAHLGNDFRFETRVIGTGPIIDTQLQGDLYLVGGGDPHLDSDSLAELAQAVAQAGIRTISGRFYVVDTALPQVEFIDPSQPIQVGYNPSVSGLNLNFNRIYFEWKKTGGAYRVTMDARAEQHRPQVSTSEMRIVNRGGPIYSYTHEDDVERWSVARGALGDGGGRWLPVRDAGRYTAAVFQALACAHDITLPTVQKRATVARGRVIARRLSPNLRAIQRSMLYFSTNLTAEVLGMRASQAAGHSISNLRSSGRFMARWASRQTRLSSPVFFNHSGLSDRSEISARDMTSLLALQGSRQGLAGLMKRIQMVNPRGNAVTVPGVEIFAKTGTLNFTRGLAGYIETGGRQKLAFAIFSADMAARRAAPAGEERPLGARSWSTNARTQEKALLYRWATQFA
ncbi:MAG: D-alanyl-D-alanine carboxypeptidase/D-alanyl-D-alanine-endopeptidase [Rhodobacteraceae bacterium]|nr:D-alanyl-D-alanine carboxypeptidase/D-alanyl-D-alanine-endopeptidase [Paracoccaceae bacterium]